MVNEPSHRLLYNVTENVVEHNLFANRQQMDSSYHALIRQSPNQSFYWWIQPGISSESLNPRLNPGRRAHVRVDRRRLLFVDCALDIHTLLTDTCCAERTDLSVPAVMSPWQSLTLCWHVDGTLKNVHATSVTFPLRCLSIVFLQTTLAGYKTEVFSLSSGVSISLWFFPLINHINTGVMGAKWPRCRRALKPQ